jgi:predicted transcriptional regulator
MLTELFGNPNIERILLFLFVNETCYGTQLQATFNISLTPIQQALKRLEKGGIIKAKYQGKKKLYEINPSYPLKIELEQLLKKAYTLLPCKEKKRYFFVQKNKKKPKENELLAFWEKLCRVKHLRLTTKSKTGDEKITQTGVAEVIAKKESSQQIIFQEKGIWIQDSLPSSSFSNQFRWTLHPDDKLISLEHLRYGQNMPVFLFHLSCTGPNTLESIEAHLCGQDTYLGHIIWDDKKIHFHWRVIGQNKNDELHYEYH